MSQTSPIRALIVDDEPLARERVRTLLAQEPDVDVAGECAGGAEAVDAIRALAPDLVFLDVQMPGVDGFGVIEQIGGERLPALIFVTAYDQFALRAFEVHALDYLLKPFDRERFGVALDRARKQIELERRGELDQRLAELMSGLRPGARHLDRVVVKSLGRIAFLRADEIDWIEACGNYLRIHAGREEHLLRETLVGLESRLDPQRFLRVHRSTIVNVDRIRELVPQVHGDYTIQLHDGTKLTLSRSHRERAHELLGRAL